MNKKGNKTYYFTATLNPPEYCRDFNPGELHIGNGYVIDIFFNGITIWNPKLRADFVKIRPFVNEIFDMLISTFIFREHMISKRIFKLSLSIQRCIEARDVSSKSNLIWTLDYPVKKIYSPSTKARVNVTWRRAAKYFKAIHQSSNHKIMLKDYKSCIGDSGDNAFFFAYRIIEDIRRAINLEKGITDERNWKELHKSLNTRKTFIDPLTNVATKVRHGNIKSPIVVNARQKDKREKILKIAFDLMKREFERKFPGFL